jgi:hypothetical protein
MKKVISYLGLICLFVLTSYVAKMKIFSHYEKGTDFKKYKTYAWISPYDTIVGEHRKNKPYGHFIMKTVDAQLAKKGMTTDTLNPDVVFMFDTKHEETTEYKESGSVYVGVSVYAPAMYRYQAQAPAFDPNGYNRGSETPSYGGIPSSGLPNMGYGYMGGYGYGYGAATKVAGGKVTHHTVESGELIVNMYDTKTKHFIWGAGADEDMTIETDIPLTIQKAVNEMFIRLPINVKK